MLDETTGASAPTPRCNWCSAPLPSENEVTCPSCGATLLEEGDASVPGLTAIDAEAILRNARAAKARPRSRLLGWISGDYDDGEATVAATPGSLAPPPADVRREMLRLEIEAQLANAQAEVEAMTADEAVEEGRSLAAAADTSDAGAVAIENNASNDAVADETASRAATVAAADERADEAPPA